ncbi:hypothetical protein K440DRAFT_106232 [Wilcoxina mikolae CBS 423.85]|nr:hypothetical protein K440DRAFT_106232 [Wilcoxina mikolae CBS 423.85]
MRACIFHLTGIWEGGCTTSNQSHPQDYRRIATPYRTSSKHERMNSESQNRLEYPVHVLTHGNTPPWHYSTKKAYSISHNRATHKTPAKYPPHPSHHESTGTEGPKEMGDPNIEMRPYRAPEVDRSGYLQTVGKLLVIALCHMPENNAVHHITSC